MKYIYGPVKSRRLGLSLGISLVEQKTCNFDCIYCQLGHAEAVDGARIEYVKIEEVLGEFKEWLKANSEESKKLDYITLSGFGEPLLNSKIPDLILGLKNLTSVKIAVITNSSLLTDENVRRALLQSDLIVPSLDAATQKIFEKIDRPYRGIRLEDIINGLVSLRKEYKGKIWVEVMLVKGINDDLRHINKLKEAIERINPDKIQINSPVRAVDKEILPVERRKIEKIRSMFGEKAEIV